MNLVERLEEAFEKKVGGTAMLPASDVLSASVELQRQDERIRALEAQLAASQAMGWPKAKERIEALEAENASLREDAERYRWLREYLISDNTDFDDDIVGCYSSESMDNAIDAARGKA